MALFNSKLAAAAAMLAAASTGMVPAAAADIQVPRTSSAAPVDAGWTSGDEVYDHRRYRRHHHNRGVGAGDLIVGAIILGTIAAASGSRQRERDERYRDRDYRSGDYRNRDSRNTDYRYRTNDRDRRSDSGGLDRAAQMCVREIERDGRVENVDSVNRTGEGWTVTGTLYDGENFRCTIDNDGRISDIDVGGRDFESSAAPSRGSQWEDDRYARAWSQAGSQPADRSAEMASQPAYPGGPVDDNGDDNNGGDDGRYVMAD
ncbi:hypothetical protein [Altererythrobacter aquiaggeris]|uniref:hypothetical protein n=1 Tax=Aestuarierythrobacter aquiaggeris TaxID=1898396 RepID=UPI00301A2B9C